MKKEFKTICKNSDLIGAEMIVSNEKKIIKNFRYGYRDLNSDKKVNLNTKFRIASISKIIVAMCVMQLSEKKLLSIDDDISNFLSFKIRNPKYPTDIITVKHLMTQTSSITDGFEDVILEKADIKRGYNGVNVTNIPAALKDLLIKNEGPYWTSTTFSSYKPGEKFIYSNFGCGILACIIEKITKQLFSDYVIENIFSKMHIDASFRINDIKNKSNFSTLYYVSNQGETIKQSLNFEKLCEIKYDIFPLGENYRGPAGGLIISIKDLSKIMQVFLNNGSYNKMKILKKDTVDFMQQLHWLNTEVSDYKAKGLQLRIYSKTSTEILRGHTGDAYGLVSFFFYNPEQKLGACFFTNGGTFRKLPSGIVDVFEKLLTLAFKKNWNYKKNNTLTIYKKGLIAKKNDRIIKMPRPIYYKNGMDYVSFLTLLDGLDIIPTVSKNLITVEKKNNKILFQFEDFININNIYYVELKSFLNHLKLNFFENDEAIEINYYN